MKTDNQHMQQSEISLKYLKHGIKCLTEYIYLIRILRHETSRHPTQTSQALYFWEES